MTPAQALAELHAAGRSAGRDGRGGAARAPSPAGCGAGAGTGAPGRHRGGVARGGGHARASTHAAARPGRRGGGARLSRAARMCACVHFAAIPSWRPPGLVRRRRVAGDRASAADVPALGCPGRLRLPVGPGSRPGRALGCPGRPSAFRSGPGSPGRSFTPAGWNALDLFGLHSIAPLANAGSEAMNADRLGTGMAAGRGWRGSGRGTGGSRDAPRTGWCEAGASSAASKRRWAVRHQTRVERARQPSVSRVKFRIYR